MTDFLLLNGSGYPKSYLVDCMLGRLAKWMRILGLDTEYERRRSDDGMIDLALRTGRLLVTRDRVLANRKAIRRQCLLIAAANWPDQLQEFISRAGCQDQLRPFSRCLACNQLIQDNCPEGIASQLPAFIQERHHVQRFCPACRRCYWPGSHQERMLLVLKTLHILPG